ncbi:hypothetical protein HY637_05730 [Candidatus Woesearchaeota archaeon]|nr:hypothetical protein [Candidatus Woesearchaeota archaeon]
MIRLYEIRRANALPNSELTDVTGVAEKLMGLGDLRNIVYPVQLHPSLLSILVLGNSLPIAGILAEYAGREELWQPDADIRGFFGDLGKRAGIAFEQRLRISDNVPPSSQSFGCRTIGADVKASGGTTLTVIVTQDYTLQETFRPQRRAEFYQAPQA